MLQSSIQSVLEDIWHGCYNSIQSVLQVSSKGMLELSRSWKTIPPIKLVRLPRQRRSSHIRPYPRVSSAPTSTFSRGKCDPRALFLVPCIHHGAVKKRTGTVDDITTPAFVTYFHTLSWNFHGTAKKNKLHPQEGGYSMIFHDFMLQIPAGSITQKILFTIAGWDPIPMRMGPVTYSKKNMSK